MTEQPNQRFGKPLLNNSRTTVTIILLAIIACIQSCSCKHNNPGKEKSKTLFYTVGMTTDQFLKLIGTKDFQSINFQYQNARLDSSDNFQFDVLGYAWKKEETKAGEFFQDEFAKPVPGRKNYDFVPPYRFANLELWKDTIETFFKRLDSAGTPINTFDSVLLIPFKDKNAYASLYVVPIKKGEDVDADNLPLLKAEGKGGQQPKAAAPPPASAPAGRYMSVRPCPPDCPHRADATQVGRAMTMDEVKHVH